MGTDYYMSPMHRLSTGFHVPTTSYYRVEIDHSLFRGCTVDYYRFKSDTHKIKVHWGDEDGEDEVYEEPPYRMDRFR